MAQSVRIVTDCVADLPADLAAKFRIEVVPVHITFGDESYLIDGIGDYTWFYERLESGKILPTTAAPAPHEFLKVYRRLLAEGAESILGIFAAGQVSSIYDHASIAAQQLPSGRVHLVDTGQVSMGLGWLVIMAAEALARGASLEDTIMMIGAARSRAGVLGVLDSGEHLRRGGRVSWATARFMELLQIKPFILFESGQAHLLERVRTYRRALRRIVDLLTTWTPLERLAILQAYAEPERIAVLEQLLLPLAPQQPIRVVDIGPVFGTHIGPRCMGVAFIRAASTDVGTG